MNQQVANSTLEAGSTVLLDKGEYSDYSVIGVFKVLRTFQPINELRLFVTKKLGISGLEDAADKAIRQQHFEPDEFTAHLIRHGFIVDIEYNTLYLGGYYADIGEVDINKPTESDYSGYKRFLKE